MIATINVDLSELDHRLANDRALREINAFLAKMVNRRNDMLNAANSRYEALRIEIRKIQKRLLHLKYKRAACERRRKVLRAQCNSARAYKSKRHIELEKRRDKRIRVIKTIFAQNAVREAKRLAFDYQQ